MFDAATVLTKIYAQRSHRHMLRSPRDFDHLSRFLYAAQLSQYELLELTHGAQATRMPIEQHRASALKPLEEDEVDYRNALSLITDEIQWVEKSSFKEIKAPPSLPPAPLVRGHSQRTQGGGKTNFLESIASRIAWLRDTHHMSESELIEIKQKPAAIKMIKSGKRHFYPLDSNLFERLKDHSSHFQRDDMSSCRDAVGKPVSRCIVLRQSELYFGRGRET